MQPETLRPSEVARNCWRFHKKSGDDYAYFIGEIEAGKDPLLKYKSVLAAKRIVVPVPTLENPKPVSDPIQTYRIDSLQVNTHVPFENWLDNQDSTIQKQIEKRLERLEQGFTLSEKPLRECNLLLQSKLEGLGLRIYFMLRDDVILLLGAGKKAEQESDVKKYAEIARQVHEEKITSMYQSR